jgi:diguanylate cyclase (GGDEF)-like protein
LHAKREKEPLFLALIDIDHFKLYNDLYGHQAGDEVLRLVGNLLARYARRPLDMAVRLAGEEFALAAYDESVDSLRARMEQLLIDLHGLNLALDASVTAPYVTVSIGLAQVRSEDTVDSVFRLADSLLLQAKEQGRNRVCGVASIVLPVINPRRPSWAQQAAAMGPDS